MFTDMYTYSAKMFFWHHKKTNFFVFVQVMCCVPVLMETHWRWQWESPNPLFPQKAAQMYSLGQENISTSPASTKGPIKYGELIVLG